MQSIPHNYIRNTPRKMKYIYTLETFKVYYRKMTGQYINLKKYLTPSKHANGKYFYLLYCLNNLGQGAWNVYARAS